MIRRFACTCGERARRTLNFLFEPRPALRPQLAFGHEPELHLEAFRAMMPLPDVVGALTDLIFGDRRFCRTAARSISAQLPTPRGPSSAESSTASLPISPPV